MSDDTLYELYLRYFTKSWDYKKKSVGNNTMEIKLSEEIE